MLVLTRVSGRCVYAGLLFLLALGTAAPCAAQSFGIGGRMATIRTEVGEETDSERFWGGHIRLGIGQRAAIEVSLDRRTEDLELLNERVQQTPIQTSLLLFLAGGGFRPYVLGGPGWYKTSIEPLDVEEPLLEVKSTEFGWHAGFGAEIRAGRHIGIHGDYRYTFLDFGGDDDDEGEGIIGRLLPSSGGSMWTVGATIYF